MADGRKRRQVLGISDRTHGRGERDENFKVWLTITRCYTFTHTNCMHTTIATVIFVL